MKKRIRLALALMTFAAIGTAPALAAANHPTERHNAATRPAAKPLYNYVAPTQAPPSTQMPVGGPGSQDFNNQAWPGGEPGGGMKSMK
jgi:hypothetical protein